MTQQPDSAPSDDAAYPESWKPAHVRQAEAQARDALADDSYPSYPSSWLPTKGLDEQ
jgi:hypothetical protein